MKERQVAPLPSAPNERVGAVLIPGPAPDQDGLLLAQGYRDALRPQGLVIFFRIVDPTHRLLFETICVHGGFFANLAHQALCTRGSSVCRPIGLFEGPCRFWASSGA